MAEQNNRQQQEAGQPRQQEAPGTHQQGPVARPCPKDCRRCSMQQQVCCSSMLSFQMFEVMNSVIQRLDAQTQQITGLERRLQAIQGTESELSSPQPVQGDLFAGEE